MKKSTALFTGFFFLLIGIVAGAALASSDDFKLFFTKHIEVLYPSKNNEAPEDEHSDDFSLFPKISLSDQALENIGITPGSWKQPTKENFPKVRSFPAILVERPGRSTFQIPASVSGVVSRVYHEQGERVRPGQPLFDIVLTHEDLVQCQTALHVLFQKRFIIEKELERLQPLLRNEVAPKAIREYEIQKIEIDAQIASQKALLLLHGLPKDRVNSLGQHILETLQKSPGKNISDQDLLIRELTICVPDVVEDDFLITAVASSDTTRETQEDIPLVLEQLNVEKGKLVSQGETLCQISNFSRLYVEGKAFARDEALLNTAFTKQNHVWVVFDDRAATRELQPGLHIKKLDNRIDAVNRTLNFYVEIDNRILDPKERWDGPQHAGHAHLDTDDKERLYWRFKPGQRCEINIEYENLEDCFVVPQDAVAEDGAEAFVFAINGISKWKMDGNIIKQMTFEDEEANIPYFSYKIWHKKPIKIEARDQYRVAFKPVYIVDPESKESVPSVLPTDYLAQAGANQLNDAFNSGSGKLQSTCPCGNH